MLHDVGRCGAIGLLCTKSLQQLTAWGQVHRKRPEQEAVRSLMNSRTNPQPGKRYGVRGYQKSGGRRWAGLWYGNKKLIHAGGGRQKGRGPTADAGRGSAAANSTPSATYTRHLRPSHAGLQKPATPARIQPHFRHLTLEPLPSLITLTNAVAQLGAVRLAVGRQCHWRPYSVLVCDSASDKSSAMGFALALRSARPRSLALMIRCVQVSVR
jgi:hypothetical protein